MKNWMNITSEEDLQGIIERSTARTQIIFKDSTTCGISAHAKERLLDGFDIIDGKADFNYLDLLTYRPISNLIAKLLDVTHQSPQIIVLKDKKVIYTASHHAISPDSIAKVL